MFSQATPYDQSLLTSGHQTIKPARAAFNKMRAEQMARLKEILGEFTATGGELTTETARQFFKTPAGTMVYNTQDEPVVLPSPYDNILIPEQTTQPITPEQLVATAEQAQATIAGMDTKTFMIIGAAALALLLLRR